MKLLHTADWHLGRRLFGVDRLGESRAVMAELAEIAAHERVDATLVAGDLLDRRLVDPEALGACLAGLEALAAAAPVVVVTGNHDDPAFWGHLGPYLAHRGIHVASRVADPSDAVRTLATASGLLHVACLPWVDPAALGAAPGTHRRAAHGSYADDVASLLDLYAGELRRRHAGDGGATVLLGHVMVDGARPGGGERELTLGLTHAVSASAVPTDLDYVALGHVHRPQPTPRVSAACRYAGSPLALDFSEDNHVKSAAVVEIAAGTTAVAEVPLSAGRRLARIRGTLDALPALASAHPGAFFFCEVDLERADLDLVRAVRERVPDALRIEPRYAPVDDDAGAGAVADDVAPERALVEHYADWYRRAGKPLDPRQAAAFAEALADAERVAG